MGATAELVERTAQALADEVAQARLCFALASRYADGALGPSTLDIDGSIAAVSLSQIVELTIVEGCWRMA